MKKVLFIAFGLFILALFSYYRIHPLAKQLEINGHRFTVEFAITEQEKARGLGYRESLPENTGMLFAYDHPERYSFWMKGMKFPIDIIWIHDQKIIDIHTNVPVANDGHYPTYSPKSPASQVFEVNAGTVDRLVIRVGDSVKITNQATNRLLYP